MDLGSFLDNLLCPQTIIAPISAIPPKTVNRKSKTCDIAAMPEMSPSAPKKEPTRRTMNHLLDLTPTILLDVAKTPYPPAKLPTFLKVPVMNPPMNLSCSFDLSDKSLTGIETLS